MKRLIVIVFIIFGAFLTFSLYRTFAYDTSVVEEVPSTTDLEYTFKIGNSSIKQITVDSGETRYYDIVLGNPNNAKISYSIYYEMVSPSSKPDDYKIEYTSKSTGESTGIVNNNGNITLNIVVTNTSSNAVTVKVGTVAGYVKGGDLELSSNQEFIPKKKPKISEYVMSLDDGTTGDDGSGVYKVSHEAIASDSSATGREIKASDDYRYYGASPNNYICLDMEGGSTCPDRSLFRIIGSIYEENADTNLIKVIKASPLTHSATDVKIGFSWDCKGSDTNVKLLAMDPDAMAYCTSSYDTIWSGQVSDATIMQLLNGIYLTGGTSSYFTDGDYVVNFLNSGLTTFAQKLINSGKENKNLSRYYLGGYSHTDEEKNTEKSYLFERGSITSSGNSLYWDGKIGLMYPSDYGYAAGNDCATDVNLTYYNDSCKLKDWLYESNYSQWTITPDLGTNMIWDIRSHGDVGATSVYDNFTTVRPTFYLDKDVSITSGTGTESDPYQITLSSGQF